MDSFGCATERLLIKCTPDSKTEGEDRKFLTPHNLVITNKRPIQRYGDVV